MNAPQKHQALVDEYRESANTVLKSRMYAFAFQVGAWAILFCLKNLHFQQVNLIAAILFGLFLINRLSSFNLRRTLDEKMSQITLEGLKLEQGNPRIERFFRQVLQDFGIIRVMILRVMVDLMAVYLFTSAAYQLALDYTPSLVLNIKAYYPVMGVLGFFIGDLYYKPLEPLMKAKQEVFSN